MTSHWIFNVWHPRPLDKAIEGGFKHTCCGFVVLIPHDLLMTSCKHWAESCGVPLKSSRPIRRPSALARSTPATPSPSCEFFIQRNMSSPLPPPPSHLFLCLALQLHASRLRAGRALQFGGEAQGAGRRQTSRVRKDRRLKKSERQPGGKKMKGMERRARRLTAKRNRG